MLIDAHAHINFRAFKEDADEVVKRSLAENIWMINVGAEYNSSRRAIDYAKKYPEGVFAAVGLHPIHLSPETTVADDGEEKITIQGKAEKYDRQAYEELAREDKVAAIGEVGLDYYHIDTDDSGRIEEIKKLQKAVLREQIELAIELALPVIFHCREAHNDLLEILKDYKLGELRGVIHSFSGRWSQAEQYLACGFYLGFNGIITFARDYDRVVKEMPLDRLILETDCPYLTPIPFRGKRNEPAYVKFVAEKVAELRNLPFYEVAKKTTENARRLFSI